MELRHLRYFVAVAAEGNFTRAAEKLHIGQPPLSQQIRDLEGELEVKLFHRTPRGAELTEAGRAFQVEAQRLLQGAEEAKAAARRAQQGETGQLRVGLTGSAAFNPVVPTTIRNFRRAYPRVHMRLDEGNTLLMLEALREEKLDAIFIRPGPEAVGDVQMRRFADEPMKIVLPTGHRLARKKSLPLAALAEETFVLVPRAIGSGHYDEVVGACRKAGFEPVIGQGAPQMSLTVNLVAAEMGVSVVPASFVQVKVAGVRYLDIEGRMLPARLALCTRKGDRAATVRNFLAQIPRGT
ncbi:MAG TPA: LysR family transcriptional regulator [Burkholderiales bacterium]|jgi:DNA-binding transcriptional LysR family regulator